MRAQAYGTEARPDWLVEHEVEALAGRCRGASLFEDPQWLQAWADAPSEDVSGSAFVWQPDGGRVVAAHRVVRSPLWTGYEADASVEPVFDGPVAFAPSIYAVYGPTGLDGDSLPPLARTLAELAAGWDCQALVVSGLARDEVAGWRRAVPGAVAFRYDDAFRLPLSDDADGYLAGLSRNARGNLRRECRRATERGVVCTVEAGDGAAVVDDLHDLVTRSAKAHGIPPLYGKDTLRRLLSVPGAAAMMARTDGEPQAGLLTFRWRDRFYTYAAGVNHEQARELHAYPLLCYESVKRAIALGCRVYEYGRSNRTFKERRGFRASELWCVACPVGGRPLPGARLEGMARALARFLGG